MQRIIFLGTDLHGTPSEHASKLVRDLKTKINGRVLSIENRKPRQRGEAIIIPKIMDYNPLRKIVQALLLPIYLLILRIWYNSIFSFWTPSGKYHYFLFLLLRILNYKTIFTIISGESKDYSCLNFCDVIICQSDRMYRKMKLKFPNKDIRTIYPWTNLELFKPGKKEPIILIPSVPYRIGDFEERGMGHIIKIIKERGMRAIVIFRSDEAYNYFRGLKLKGAELINKVLSDKELSEIMARCKVVPLLYNREAPDMPLSAIEGLASGCLIVSTKNVGLSEMIEKAQAGIIADEEGFEEAIKEGLTRKADNHPRKLAERLFSQSNIKEYAKLAENDN